MRWFRSNRRLGGWVALFALTVQLVLSFGHIHAIPAGDPEIVTAAVADAGAPPPQPGPARHHQDDDDYCAICAVLALLSGAQTSDAPVLPALVALASAEVVVTAEVVRIDPPRAAFRSRAPPQA